MIPSMIRMTFHCKNLIKLFQYDFFIIVIHNWNCK